MFSDKSPYLYSLLLLVISILAKPIDILADGVSKVTKGEDGVQ